MNDKPQDVIAKIPVQDTRLFYKRWENYEYIMADIFDHLMSALPFFDLELYEFPLSLPPIPQT